MAPPTLEARAISKHYGPVTALEEVDLKLMPGEVVGLVGDNGAGKSTLVKIMAGLIRPDRGAVIVDGEERHWSTPREAVAAGIETAYQDAGLAPHLSVSANLFLGREVRRRGLLGALRFVDEPEMRSRAARELAKVGIHIPNPNLPVARLSGGQRQSVVIGRAVAWARRALILDEPTNHLGVKEQAEVLRLIREACDRGLGVIVVSHTLPHVFEVTDRIVVLRLGRLVSVRRTSETTVNEVIRDITGLAEGATVSL